MQSIACKSKIHRAAVAGADLNSRGSTTFGCEPLRPAPAEPVHSWIGIVLALNEPGDDEMQSRLATHLHPLAGRPLIWHTVHAFASFDPAPDYVLVFSGEELSPELFDGITGDIRVRQTVDKGWGEALFDSGLPSPRALVVDAAAPTLPRTLQPLLESDFAGIVRDRYSFPLAAWLNAEALGEVTLGKATLRELASRLPPHPCATHASAVGVRDRQSFSRVVAIIQRRLIRRMMRDGVSFLLPETVVLDVDVRIGRDTVIYPGVVLEGQTTVGQETVIGPGCRIIDSWIGSGVELKGWNYIARSSIRNRAILEPYVRRGFD